MCFIEAPERWCIIGELGESWVVKIDLMLGNAMNFIYSGEDRAFWWRQTSAFPVRARLMGLVGIQGKSMSRADEFDAGDDGVVS